MCDCGNCNCAPQVVIERTGNAGPAGNNGWTPVPAIVSDGERRVIQITDYVGGTGTKPVTGLYVGASTLVSDIADAVDIRGEIGATGADGATGDNGWSPVFAVATEIIGDLERKVLEVVDWVGGDGVKPDINVYVTAFGFSPDISDGVDIRGAAGADANPLFYPPIGAEMTYWGDTDPNANWMIRDGRSLVAASYPDLFALIGYTYGGSGANFSLPNAPGRVVAGLDAGNVKFQTIGQTGGEEVHTLTIAEMPSHQHTASVIAEGAFGLVQRSITGQQTTAEFSDTGGSGTEPGLVAQPQPVPLQGGSQAHNNLQPYIVSNFIIRVL